MSVETITQVLCDLVNCDMTVQNYHDTTIVWGSLRLAPIIT